MPVFFVAPQAVRGETITIAGPLARHLCGSLRVKPGEMIWLGEDGGPRYHARLTAADRDRLTARVVSTSSPPQKHPPSIALGLALVKGDRMDWAVQKAAELGVARLVPLITARSIVRPKSGRTDHQSGRWQSIALEAAQQSMRWDVPVVAAPVSFDAWCADAALGACRWLLWEDPRGTPFRDRLRGKPRPDQVTLVIGPEGGFTADEIALAQQRGFEMVSLGSRILRTETAVVAALALVQYEWGDLG